MNTTRCFTGIALGISIGWFSGITTAYGARQNNTVSFKVLKEERMIVPVHINGEGPYSFLLDTGAEVTVLDERIASRLGLKRITEVPVTHFTGSTRIPLAPIRDLALGNSSVPNMYILYCNLRRLWGLDRQIRGVLGQDFLSRFNYWIHWDGRVIQFEQDRDLAPHLVGARLPFEKKNGRCYVSIPSDTSPRQPQRLVLDSGSSYFLIYESPTKRVSLDVVRVEPQELVAATAVGRRKLKCVRVGAFQIGNVTLESLPVRIAQLLPGESLHEDGLLPLCLFESVYVNNEDNYVVFNPILAVP